MSVTGKTIEGRRFRIWLKVKDLSPPALTSTLTTTNLSTRVTTAAATHCLWTVWNERVKISKTTNCSLTFYERWNLNVVNYTINLCFEILKYLFTDYYHSFIKFYRKREIFLKKRYLYMSAKLYVSLITYTAY